jgi:hypothetical protein
MKLITEQLETVNIITEQKENGKKNYFLEGVYLQGDIQNKNGRMYSRSVLENAVNIYTNEYINKNRAYGELGHPAGPTINLERVSHMIKELRQDGSNFIGKAKIMTETPFGQIVKNLIDEGANLGVSSRGMGSLKENKKGIMEVQDDFFLSTAADIVADPSAPNAFVRGIMEGKEWVWENGNLRELEMYKRAVERSVVRKTTEETGLKIFEHFIKSLSTKKHK